MQMYSIFTNKFHNYLKNFGAFTTFTPVTAKLFFPGICSNILSNYFLIF